MTVEELLRSDARRVMRDAVPDDPAVMLRRISRALASTDSYEAAWTVDGDASSCPDDAELDVSPLAELRRHLGHALQRPACARRAAELLELLGEDRSAEICWRHAAKSGDPDAQAYVAEFMPPPVAWTAQRDREQLAELARAYA